MKEKIRAIEVYKILEKLYPETETALKNWDGIPWKLVMCVVMSARTTDKQVNVVTEKLFKKYRTLLDFAKADLEGLTLDISSIGFYKNKAKFLKNLAIMLLENYDGKVPMDVDEMQKLPGVGRKTANVVLSVVDQPVGIAVDTHVERLSQRLGFTDQKTPNKIERDLMKVFPRETWDELSLRLIDHGRAVCTSRRPKCNKCEFAKLCPSANLGFSV